ncbi:hypothetical protein A5893_05505 [Pedobacter psychrophilus]|uniref:Outer membrane protein beta-barrel domain-containing protein n=1 Tax=Pedobacter psychrophilus TaxID=1826909 RepID=A0A179DH68_9SPHI|nr:outer membrane beta-barrel protein [Pedobacter psychrophilus]OAQ40405.1 hypothetical protein A5893_05505 [Pedobacter psychrophilus]
MKNVIFLIFIFLTVNSFAQSEKTLGFGFKIGIGKATVAYNKTTNASLSANNSDVISAFLNYSINEKLNFQSGLSYLSKGVISIEEMSDNTGGSFFYSYRLTAVRISYIELPLNAVLKLPLSVMERFC